MKGKKISIILLFIFTHNSVYSSYYGINTFYKGKELDITQLSVPLCKDKNDYQESDIPTIFVPGILASWYSSKGLKNNKIKRWIPDPITHAYDTLFFTFARNGYLLKDVFYKNQSEVEVRDTPKHGLYLFGYDWKKDNKFTATLLNKLISQVRDKYIEIEGCDIGTVNLLAHSMGGLVARTMLEDMCISEVDMKFYENRTRLKGELKEFESIRCKNRTHINQFITIATPHRGSPKALQLWEKGGISKVEDFFVATPLKSQFGIITDRTLYNIIHGYSSKAPTGLVGIGQLLPDISNETSFNKKLHYLTKYDPVLRKNIQISTTNYPENSYLEELNSTKNINKIWSRVNNYTSYYATRTGNNEKNNIIGYALKSTVLYRTETPGEYIIKTVDRTENQFGQDIYGSYSEAQVFSNQYNIHKNIRNETGKGGDGTVPSNNGLLVANDSISGIEVSDSKFQSQEIKCYDTNNKNNESSVYKNISGVKYGICGHSKMPTAAAIQAYEKISGKKIIVGSKKDVKNKSERTHLLNMLGYVNYNGTSQYSKCGVLTGQGSLNLECENDYIRKESLVGIDNNDEIHTLFQGRYNRLLNAEDIKDYLDNKTQDDERIQLKYGSKIDSIKKLLRYEVLSPINLLITDSQGRRIGIDPDTGMIVNEIPGAWTSGDTEGSGEPEFFLIPESASGAVEHSIETFGTGDGEYHIVVSDLENETTMIIEGEAREVFGEDYSVVMDETGSGSFENLTDSMPAELSFDQEEYFTNQENFTLRYSLRGNAKGVEKIKYIVSKNNKKIESKILDITGKIPLSALKNGEYIIGLQLLDSENNIITSPLSTQIISVNKIADTRPEHNGGDLRKSIETRNLRPNSYDIILERAGPGKLQIVFAGKTKQIFSHQDDFSYSGSLKSPMSLKHTNKKFEIYDSQIGRSYVFDEKSLLLEEIIDNHLSTKLFYTSEKIINYISDFKNNSLFFEYDDTTKGIINIRDISNNIVDMSQVSYPLKPEMKKDIIVYLTGQDDKLYSFLDNKVYNFTSGKRKNIINSKHIIQAIFVDINGNIYYKTKDKIFYYDALTKKIDISFENTANFSSFVILNDILYYTDRFQKGYFSQEKSDIYHWDSSKIFSQLELGDNKIVLLPFLDTQEVLGQNIVSVNPELINKKIAISHTLELASTKAKQKLGETIVRKRSSLLENISHRYTRLLVEDLLNFLGEELQE